MKYGERIKAIIGARILENKLRNKKRSVTVCNIKDAQHIGILYNATEYVSFEIIKEFTKKLAQENSALSILGYVNSKKLIDHYLYRKGFDFFSRNDLNWYYRPVSEITEEFIKKPFDILIDLSLEPVYPIQYIVALSPATFKVGKFSPDEKHLDLMIDIEKEKEQMNRVREEIAPHRKDDKKSEEMEKEIEKKTRMELQLSFLITQIMHYLAILKK